MLMLILYRRNITGTYSYQRLYNLVKCFLYALLILIIAFNWIEMLNIG